MDARLTYKTSALNGGTITALDFEQWQDFDPIVYGEYLEKEGIPLPENLKKLINEKRKITEKDENDGSGDEVFEALLVFQSE